MNSGNLKIPCFQPLSLGDIFIGKNGNKRVFPFSSDRAIYYYLARNGIWHGIDVLGLKRGDEVLMPAYHHGVETEVLKNKGLNLRYYLVNKKFEIDVGHLESLINSRTRLIYIIHYIGIPQPIKYIKDLAERRGIFLFEDCALSLFSKLPTGEPLGTFGDVSIFCLYKTLPVPHGGMLIVNKEDLHLNKRTERPTITSTLGYIMNRFLNNLVLKGGSKGYQVASFLKYAGQGFKKTAGIETIGIDTNQFEPRYVNLGISRITRHLLECIDFEKTVHKRRNNFIYLARKLSDTVAMPITDLPEGVCPLFLPIFVDDKPFIYEKLKRHGICTVNFWSYHNKDIPVGEFPDVDYLRQHVLEIPIHQGLSEKHLDFIAEVLLKKVQLQER